MSESNTVVTPTATGSEGTTPLSDILAHLSAEELALLPETKVKPSQPEEEIQETAETEGEELPPEASTEEEEAPEGEESPEEENQPSEKIQKRIDKITRKAKEAEERAAKVEQELAEARAELASRAEIKLAPSEKDPLADVESLAELQSRLTSAKKLRSWAMANMDGVEVELPNGAGSRFVDRAEMLRYLASTEELLTEHGPARQQVLQAREALLPDVKKTYPSLFQAGSEEHRMMVDALTRCPELKKFPAYEQLIGDAIAGMRARMAGSKAAAQTQTKPAQALGKKTVIAPAIPRAASAGSTHSQESNSKKEAYAAFMESGSQEDLTRYFATR